MHKFEPLYRDTLFIKVSNNFFQLIHSLIQKLIHNFYWDFKAILYQLFQTSHFFNN